jgi:hypothetical protein
MALPVSLATGELEAGLRRHRRHNVVVVACVVAALALVAGQRGQIGAAIGRLGRVAPGWLLAAVIAEIVSYAAMAELQRHLLAVGGSPATLRSMVALAWASDAVSASLPVGAPASAIYSYRHMTRAGASPELALWVMATSAILSTSALLSVCVLGAEMQRPIGSSPTLAVLVDIGVMLAAACVVVGVLVWVSARPSWLDAVAGRFRSAARISARLARALGASGGLTGAADVSYAAPVPLGRAAAASGFILALVNWAADGGALAFSLAALGAAPAPSALVLAYALAQLASNVPLIPGALGIAEGSLAVVLISAGVPAADALAAALIYRFVSYWLQLPVGWVMWAALRRGEEEALDPSDGETTPLGPALVH